MPKIKKISRHKKGVMVASIGALTFATGGLVSACAASATSDQVDFSTTLVAENFEFDGFDGAGTIHADVVRELPSGYEYRASVERLGQTNLPLNQIQGLQNGDTVTIEIFDSQTQLAYPSVDPLEIIVNGLRDVNLTTDLGAATFTFSGISGFGRMTIGGDTLPDNFHYEVSRDRSTWLPSDTLRNLLNHEVIYARIIGSVADRTTAPVREVTVDGLTPNKAINFETNAQEYITRNAFSVSRVEGTLHVNPGYELPAGYEYSVYVKRLAEITWPGKQWLEPSEVRGLLADDAMSINLYNITSGTQVLVGSITVIAHELYDTIPYLHEDFFDVEGGQVTVTSQIALPPEMQYQFWTLDGPWVSLSEINANGGIPPLTPLWVRIVNNDDPTNPVFTNYISIPWEHHYLQPDFFQVTNGNIIVTAPQALPSGLSYQYWVNDTQGWTSIENVQNIPVGTTIYVQIVGTTLDGQPVDTDFLTIPWERSYLQPDFFKINDGKVIISTPQALPSGLSYQYWVNDTLGWTNIENVPTDLLMGTTLRVKIIGQLGTQTVDTHYIQFPLLP